MESSLLGQGAQLVRAYGLWVVIATLVLRSISTRYGTPLRKYPGPLLASFTRFWQVWVAWSGSAEQHYMAAHKKYGPIIRIGPNELSFSSPYAAIELFKTGKGFYKPEFYTVFLPDGRKDIFTEIREDRHAMKKRFAVPAYSLAAIQQHTSEIEAVMRVFLSKIDKFASSAEQVPLDLGKWVHLLAFDTLGQFAFGQSFEFLQAGDDKDGAIATISKSTYESGILGQMPILDRFTRSNPLWKYVPFLPGNKAGVFLGMASAKLNECQKTEGEVHGPKSLLQSLWAAHRQNEERFSMDDVVAISMGAIAAGSDSTASTMHTFIWHVLSNPDIHNTLVQELMTSQLSDIVQYKEAQSLPYFQACLKEAMRLQPALAFNLTRRVPESGATLNGTDVPGGTIVAVNAWVMHRNNEVFGNDTDRFIPERWLGKTEDHEKLMERCMFQFGGGSHLCIGRHLAVFEINKVLPTLFRRYDMRLMSPGKPLDHVTGLFYFQSGLLVHMRNR